VTTYNVRFVVLDAGDNPFDGARVSARPFPPPVRHSGAIVGPIEGGPAGPDGIVDLALFANAGGPDPMTPDGNVYQITETYGPVQSRSYFIKLDAADLPAGPPYAASELLTDPPGSIDSGTAADHIADATDAHNASAISFVPAGSVASTDVQAAIEEVAAEAGSGVSDHGALTGLADDDHPQYATDADLATHAGAADPHPTYLTSAEGDAKVTAHEAASNPHPGYATDTDVSDLATAAAAADAAHVAASDPHTGYQRESEKSAANGYASLDSGGKVPDAELPAGLARDSEVTAAVSAHEAAGDPHPTYETSAEAAAKVTAHEGAADPHTGYQKESEKGNANGYAGLDGSGTVPDAQLPAALARDSEVTSSIATHAALPDVHHVDDNDPTAGQKAALAGTSGTPGSGNKYVTDADPRNTDARTPAAHTLASHSTKAHSELSGVGADDHHAQSHTLASHSAKAHSDLTGIGANDHHAQAHVHGGDALTPESVEISGGPLALQGDISPTQLSADVNDYNPTGLADATTLRLSADNTRAITGLQGGADGRVLLLINVGAEQIVLKDESASSSAANRFDAYGDVILGPGGFATLWYDSTSSRWRVQPADGWNRVVKRADQTKTSDATIADDTELKFAMKANTRYLVRARVPFNTTAAADMKWRHNGPASPTRVRLKRFAIIAGGTSFGSIAIDNAYSAADIALAGTGSGDGWIEFEGTVENGSTAGDFVFRWAQGTSDASNTIVYRGSYIEYKEF
jgi:hypothetical protein